MRPVLQRPEAKKTNEFKTKREARAEAIGFQNETSSKGKEREKGKRADKREINKMKHVDENQEK